MHVEYIALTISIVSVMIAALSLGWNIYRDIILKAKVDVTFNIVTLVQAAAPDRPQYLNLTVTNFGPGPVTVSMICVKEAQVWRRILRKIRYAVITPDFTNQLSARLPAKIEVGDKVELLLPYDQNSFLKSHFTHVGINDYFGRTHWASKKDLRKAYETWKSDFGNENQL